MDFMDPRQRKRHDVLLAVGYILVGIAILMLSTILLFVAYGFGYKNGQVIQSGLVFLSSTPNPAQIYMNGIRYKNDTNTRLVLPAGSYNFSLTRAGYRNWQRTVTVQGGDVQSFTYPFLIPSTLTTTTKQEYDGTPSLFTGSPDRRWLLVAHPNSMTAYSVYDLSNPKQASVTITIPENIFSAANSNQSLQLVEWADDNNHILIKHTYDNNIEYILLNRTNPDQSINLTDTLALPRSNVEVRLINKKSDQYFILDLAKQILSRATLSSPQAQPYLSGKVMAFASYGSSTILYATPDPTDGNKADIDLYQNGNSYLIHRSAAHTTYHLDLTQYSGDLYVVLAATSENMAYVYEDPVNQITNQQIGVAVPIRGFHIAAPSSVSFSASAQYVMAEGGASFAVYDAENQQSYTYTMQDQLDQPQVHASWMDGARLLYVSGGQIVVFDYDGTNSQVLVSAGAQFPSVFDQSYKFLYTLVPSASNKSHELLTSTSLRTPPDQ